MPDIKTILLYYLGSALGERLEEKRRSQEFRGLLARLEKIVPEKKITWIYPEIRRFFSGTKRLMKEYRGKINFHDALIILAAREMGLKYIVSFDEDFDQVDCLIRIKGTTDLK